jgi:uncharacterized OsmC-like protein
MHPQAAQAHSFPVGPAPNPTEFADAAAAARQAIYWRGIARSMRNGMSVHGKTPERAETIARQHERLVAKAALRAEFSGQDLIEAQQQAGAPQ